MENKQTNLFRYDEKLRKNDKLNIYYSHNKDYSDWSVWADKYHVYYHSSGQGYKGKTPQDKIKILIEEIRKDLNDKGYFDIEIVEKEEIDK